MSCGDPYKLFRPAQYSGISIGGYSGGAPSSYRKSDFYAPSGGYLPNFGNRENLAFTLAKYEFEKKEDKQPFGDSFGGSDNGGGAKETKIYNPKQDENKSEPYNSIQSTLKIKGLPKIEYQNINSSITRYQPLKELEKKNTPVSRDDKVLTDFLSNLTKKEEIDSLTSKLVATTDGGIETLR